MNQEVKDKWIAALTSGKYTQGTGRLIGPKGHCCLGVLCELYIEENPEEARFVPESSYQMDERKTLELLRESEDNRRLFSGYPPQVIMTWAGLKDKNPEVTFETRLYDIAELNDSGDATFAQIAEVIKEQL